MSDHNNATNAGFKAKFWEEMRLYGLISLYLFVCFIVLNLYESSVKGETSISATQFTSVLIQALLIGKFILIGKVIGVGTRIASVKLLHRVALKSLAFVILLCTFKIAEEIVVGWMHNQTALHSMGELMARGMLDNLAPIFVMMLILIPLVAFVEVERAIGKETMDRLMKGHAVE